MRTRLLAVVAGAAMAIALSALPALATSSGSFTASVDNEACTIDAVAGTLTGGALGGGVDLTNGGLQVQVPTNTDIVITPSLVTGLYTDNKISSSSSTSLQNVGVYLEVTITPPAGVDPSTISIAPNTTNVEAGTCGVPNGEAGSCVIYDQRFIQVTSSVISSLAQCTALSGGTCFELTESTLSAHAFNWYANLPVSGTYTIDVTAYLLDTGSTLKSGSSAACAGPGTVTVTQVKNFSQNSPAQF